MQSAISGDYSDNERLATFTHALDLWQQSPILGAGLGVFIAQSAAWLGHPQVIHSTPLWILAEFGLFGVAVFGWIFFTLARHVWLSRSSPARHGLLLLLVVFAIFSLAHEIFYQRIFWLALGALLAQPFITKTAHVR
ncbi:MAG: O-antigen ligase family protein [Methylococcaceae bacterium]|nr:O-antigen ligase family protein [Methylococcaceae bacterium]MDP3903051.1 O-antigen ligase family protein [Methylococcaceae bacterium]